MSFETNVVFEKPSLQKGFVKIEKVCKFAHWDLATVLNQLMHWKL